MDDRAVFELVSSLVDKSLVVADASGSQMRYRMLESTRQYAVAKLVEGAQAQSSETVMALEKGVKQMERGLAMMQAMTEVSGQVQQATQQQRTSTEQVVRAIEHIAEGSRSVAATAQEIASAAARQGALAAELAGTGWESAAGADGEA